MFVPRSKMQSCMVVIRDVFTVSLPTAAAWQEILFASSSKDLGISGFRNL
jgi:hypothetical protein